MRITIMFVLVCLLLSFVVWRVLETEPRYCLTCGKPIRFLPGAEHLLCALGHPVLSLRGWYYHLTGQEEKRDLVQEQVRSNGKGGEYEYK